MTGADSISDRIQPAVDSSSLSLSTSLAAEQWSGPQPKLDTVPTGQTNLPKLELTDWPAAAAPKPGQDEKPAGSKTQAANPTAADVGSDATVFPNPNLTIDTFADGAKQLLAQLNPFAADHEVDKQFLQTVIQNNQIYGPNAQALVGMYQNFGAMATTIKSPNGDDQLVINDASIDAFESKAKAREGQLIQGATMTNWANNNLQRFSNPVGRITESEVTQALKDPKLSATDRQGLQLIQQHYGDISSWYDVLGVSKSEIAAYDKTLHSDQLGKQVDGLQFSLDLVLNRAEAPKDVQTLYAGGDPLKSIKPGAVHQGTVGDCYFEAVLSSLAQSDPTLLRDSIKDNNNGTVTVTFKGAPDKPVTVAMTTQAELAMFNGGSPDGVWASVMEKAYGVYKRAPGDTTLPQEIIGHGGETADVLQLLTGQKPNVTDLTQAKQATVVAELNAALNGPNHKAVATEIVPTTRWQQLFPSQKTPDGFYEDHAYSIIGFKPDGAGGGTVEIRNPWGLKNTADGSRFSVPIATFMKNFTQIAIQG